MTVNISPIPDRDDLDYISLRIYIKDGRLDQVVPEHPWEGQVRLQVVYHDEYLEEEDSCQDQDCPEAPDPNALRKQFHWHDWMDVAVFRATQS